MKMTIARTTLAIAALGFAGVLAAQPAQRIAPNEAPNLAASAALPASTKQPLADAKIYGLPATPRTADRTIDITPSTRWINVKQDETVALRSGDKTYAWTFATWSIGSFPLSRIVPPEFSVPADLQVYVAPDPMRDGGR
jgi:hypothetical protein